jgi:hypothetical protein
MDEPVVKFDCFDGNCPAFFAHGRLHHFVIACWADDTPTRGFAEAGQAALAFD